LSTLFTSKDLESRGLGILPQFLYAVRMPESPERKIKAKQHESTVIFVDWDDTLLCSSYLSGQGLRLDTDIQPTREVARELKDLEMSVISLLRLAKMYGDVHVVTNAETGWVQLSAKKFIPGVIPLLEEITVLSARSAYEAMFPESPLKWKFYAFREKLGELFTKAHAKNIISFGDSHVEREAVRAVTRGFPNTKTKSVKFAEKPSMEQLRRQLELVTNCFQYIHSHDGDLDLQLTVTKTEPAPASPVSSASPAAPASPMASSASPASSVSPPKQLPSDEPAKVRSPVKPELPAKSAILS